MASADLDVARRARGPACAGHRDLPAEWEGGRFDGSEEERRAILRRSARRWRGVRRRRMARRQFDGDFAISCAAIPRASWCRRTTSTACRATSTIACARDARDRRRRSIKIAVCRRALQRHAAAARRSAQDGDAVVIGMGDAGVPSRLLAARFGSRWTYAGDGVAPGQIPARQMVDEFRFRASSPTTRIFGVVSTNAMHSLSPVMHNAAFGRPGIDAVYVPLPARDFDDFLTFADAMGVEGASVTIPFKLDALQAAAAQPMR